MLGVQQPSGGVLGAVMIVPGRLNIVVAHSLPHAIQLISQSTPISDERCLASRDKILGYRVVRLNSDVG